jgi:choline-glycine betaine transporter
MKTTGIVSRVMAASSVLIVPFSAPRFGLSGDTWAMVGIVAILLAYRIVRKHRALYPMTIARPQLMPRTRDTTEEPSQTALTLSH